MRPESYLKTLFHDLALTLYTTKIQQQNTRLEKDLGVLEETLDLVKNNVRHMIKSLIKTIANGGSDYAYLDEGFCVIDFGTAWEVSSFHRDPKHFPFLQESKDYEEKLNEIDYIGLSKSPKIRKKLQLLFTEFRKYCTNLGFTGIRVYGIPLKENTTKSASWAEINGVGASSELMPDDFSLPLKEIYLCLPAELLVNAKECVNNGPGVYLEES